MAAQSGIARASLRERQASHIVGKKQGATGITTVARHFYICPSQAAVGF
jgi:hypothetical protein